MTEKERDEVIDWTFKRTLGGAIGFAVLFSFVSGVWDLTALALYIAGSVLGALSVVYWMGT